MKPNKSDNTERDVLVQRHLRFGWWTLLIFLTLGILLEAFHGFKIQFYLNVENETRRLMWRLAHAHGGLLALIHIAFALSLPVLKDFAPARRSLVSPCLIGSSILLPSGFFLGGFFFFKSDPGFFVLLVPAGGLLLLAGILLIALKTKPGSSSSKGE